MNGKLVSVIMPTYNDNPVFFRKALESIRNQTYTNIEIIIVDSSSNDTISDMVSDCEDCRIQYFFREKRGIPDALNFGLRNAHGDYIARMDADDISLPERLERQVGYMEDHQDVALLGTSFNIIDGEDNLVETRECEYNSEQLKANLIFENPICHPSVMFRAELVKKGWKYLNSCFEDYDLWTRLLLVEKASRIKESLLLYRVHGENISIKVYDSEIKEVTASTKRYVEQLFHIDVNQYEESQFLKSYFMSREKKNVLKSGYSYLKEQKKLLFQIIENNKRLHVIEESTLQYEMEKRWRLISRLFDVECTLNDDVNLYIKKGVEFWEKIKNKPLRFFFYGAGKEGSIAIEQYIKFCKEKLPWMLEGIIDKDRKDVLIGEKCFQTIPCEDIKNQANCDWVIITSEKYYDEMKSNLMQNGILDSQIIGASWLWRV